MRFRFAACVLLTLFVLSPLYGQTSTATIVGTVTDQTGAVIPGAEITATHVDTGRVRTTTTNERGDYTLTNVALGRYNVAALLEGFSQQEVSDIVLQLDQTARVNLELRPGEVTEIVTVEGTAPVLASDTSDVGGRDREHADRRAPAQQARVSAIGLAAARRRSTHAGDLS